MSQQHSHREKGGRGGGVVELGLEGNTRCSTIQSIYNLLTDCFTPCFLPDFAAGD